MTVKELRSMLGGFDGAMRVTLRQQVTPHELIVELDPMGLRVTTERGTGDYVLVLEDV